MRILIFFIVGATLALTAENATDTTDGEDSRKILGSSVVTSVSVIMDTGNGSKTVYTDAVGRPIGKPLSASELASPINLLNPDRYEFYTFDDNGDLIKRLMSLEEIKGIIATGDSDGLDIDSFTSQGYLPEKRVNEVVNTVQNVLKEEMEIHKNTLDTKPLFDTPDVSDSWSMILPAVFGNSGEDIKPEKPIIHVTPDTIMIEPNMQNTFISTPDKSNFIEISTVNPSTGTTPTSHKPISSFSTAKSTSTPDYFAITKRPLVESTLSQISTTDKLVTLNAEIAPPKMPVTEEKIKPMLNVEIYSNSKSTTPLPASTPVVEIKEKVTPTIEHKVTTFRPTTAHIVISSEIIPTKSETKLPTVTFNSSPTTSKPATIMAFTSVSPGSTLPTTKVTEEADANKINYSFSSTSVPENNIILLTKRTTEAPLTTWRSETPIPSTSEESSTTSKAQQFSTWRPEPTTSLTQLPVKNKLPTLAELLNLHKVAEETTLSPQQASSGSLTTLAMTNDEKTTTENQENTQTKFYDQLFTTEKSDEDLSTLSSEYGSLNRLKETTALPLDQVMTTVQKISASTLLDQLLLTTNIYEINTELAEKTTNQLGFSDEDQRFEMSTQEGSENTEMKSRTEAPTTEPFVIKVTENTESPVTTDQSLIGSIEQLLSQAVVDVEEVLASVNDTAKIQNMLNNSYNKTMTDVKKETATFASNMVDVNSNDNDENEYSTTESGVQQGELSDESSIISDSVGSLLSQISDVNLASVGPIQTEKYPATVAKIPMTPAAAVLYKISSTETFNLETTTSFDANSDSKNPEMQLSTPKLENSSEKLSIMPFKPNVSKDEHVLPLINITIISSESMKNRSKPAKSDVSLEGAFTNEDNSNQTSTMNESTEIYIESAFNISKYATESTTTDKSFNEIFKAEETVNALKNNTEMLILNATEYPLQFQTETPEIGTSTSSLSSIVTNIPSEKSTTSETAFSKERPTTIIIIKRTDRPPTSESSTVTTNKQNVEADDKTEATESDLEQTATTTKLLYSNEILQEVESSTQAIVKPAVEIIINENKTSPGNMESVKLETSTDHKMSAQGKNETENSNNEKVTTIAAINNESKPNLQENQNATGNSTQIIKHELTQNQTKNSPIPSKKNNTINRTETLVVDKPTKSGSTWTLVPTIAPHAEQPLEHNNPPPLQSFPDVIEPPMPIDLSAKPMQGFGLEESTSRLDNDIYQFSQLCNELAFGFWKTVTTGLSSARSVFVSPFGATSLLAMVFLGARGATSGEMNEILKLDDMVTFNPHLIFKNVSESIRSEEPDSGVATSGIIRELFSDRSKGNLLPFYKERARAFYDGFVEEVSFREIGDVIRRRTNLQVKKYTGGKIVEFLKDSSITGRSPLAGISVNLFQTDCSQASTSGRDGELHFVVLPSIRQRRLVPVPAVVYKSGFLAGYEPSLDATAVSLGNKDNVVSTIMVVPGQQGVTAPGDGLSRLEKRLVESSFKKGAWSRLLRSLIPRPNLEVQIPRFSHRSVINATVALKKMGLHDLFDIETADLRGLNGVPNELFLSDIIQINNFATCGEKVIGETHHSEVYPASGITARGARYLELYQSDDYKSDFIEEPRDYQRAFHDPLHDPRYLDLPLPLRPRQARVPETPRLKLDRPFLYFVRHNPTGLILHMGRFNPRLLP